MCEQKHSKTYSTTNFCNRKHNKTNDLATLWTENIIKHMLFHHFRAEHRKTNCFSTFGSENTIDTYNRPLQQTLTIETRNRHLQ